MGGYAWAHGLVDNALRPPGQPGNGAVDGAQRLMVVSGWERVQELRAARAALAPELSARFKRYVTRTVYRSRYGAGGQMRRETSLPTNFMEMVARAAKPGLQNDIVTHSYALELCNRIAHARITSNNNFIDR